VPILLPTGLPAAATLLAEGIDAREGDDAPTATLRIGLVNLMPDRPAAERQWARLLGAAPETVSLSLYAPPSARADAANDVHRAAFYAPLPETPPEPLDGLIVTGAPVETLPFEAVRYWDALGALLDAAAARRLPTLSVCWAGMAALHRFHGVPKQPLSRKAFGAFAQTVKRPDAALMQGLGRRFTVAVSRHASVRAIDLAGTGASLLAGSGETGVSVAEDVVRAQTMLLDHIEYEAGTLTAEFLRDRAAALPARPPENMPPGRTDDPPWWGAAHILIRNWLGAVSRAKAARAPRDLLAWLLDRHGGEPGVELVVRHAAGADPLPALVAEAAARAITVTGVRRHPDGAVALTLPPGIASAGAEALTSRAVALEGVSEAFLRGPGTAGAVLRAA
jgi:homoserine O-succinyltransferase